MRQRILDYVDAHGKITRRKVAELLILNESQAKRLLTRLVGAGDLSRQGQGKSTSYGAFS
jgi:ATP-dependent DNA helicase RecG